MIFMCQLKNLLTKKRKCNHVHTKTCTWMFIASLFKIDPSWEQTKCSMGKWTDVYLIPHSVEYYLAIKMTELFTCNNAVESLSNYTEWKKPDPTPQRAHSYKILENANWSTVRESRPVVGWGWGKSGRVRKEDLQRTSKKPLGVVVSRVYTYAKTYQIIHVKMYHLLPIIP
jgi:hypothetical protein